MLGTGEAIRVFIAVQISPESRQVLADAMGRLSDAVPRGVRWVDPQGIHLTLKFLGDIDPGLKDRMLEFMRHAGQVSSPFSLQLSSLGMFPNQRQPRVLWAGVQGDLEALADLQEEVERAMLGLGFPRERRRFSPHLTIGRVRYGVSAGVRQQIGDAMVAGSLGTAEPWVVDSMHLVHSSLTPQGAVYNSLGSAPLLSAAAD
ncbi:MAG: 2'-5' RNA ligase [SAR202 cluster bacterium Io17-Chloro-G9]|nr:MAG: 2'-5' RNA ligase [SAR202 cluster bacterium Io17-Chloro-G9]